MTRDEALEILRRYYDGCSAGDVDVMQSTFHPEVVHYFLAPNVGSAPVAGAEHLARYWRKVTARIHATWIVDTIVAEGDDAVIEWTMFWTPPDEDGAARTTGQVATRGAEWFRFEGGLIREIRSYYQQRPETTELDGFPYGDRGYSTLEQRSSDLHPLKEPTP